MDGFSEVRMPEGTYVLYEVTRDTDRLRAVSAPEKQKMVQDVVKLVQRDAFPPSLRQGPRFLVGLQHPIRKSPEEQHHRPFRLPVRAVGRRIHEETGRIYHLRYDPPPPGLEGKLVQRKDDTEEVVRTRFTEYEDKTRPVLGYYQARGLVTAINGVGTLDEVTGLIKAALGI